MSGVVELQPKCRLGNKKKDSAKIKAKSNRAKEPTGKKDTLRGQTDIMTKHTHTHTHGNQVSEDSWEKRGTGESNQGK